ncbi:hypothetical protein Tco_0945981, partial [Tanacetum coccineum]
MTTLAKYMIVADAENRPPMLDKSMYNSWESRMLLYIKGKKNGRMMLESIENGPLVYPTVEEDGQIRKKKYAELTKQEQLQDDCDVQATNIVLQGLSPNVYALVNHCQSAKDIWERGETLHEYYLRFTKLFNDMHIIGMTMQQVQVNTKFLNALQLEWSKFVTDVKLAKNMYTTNYDQLYAYLSRYEGHANEYPQQLSSTPETSHSSQPYSPTYETPHHPQPYQQGFQTQLNHSPPSVPQNAYHTPPIAQQPQAEFPQLDSGLAVPLFLPGDDPIACLNKAMEFMSTVMASRRQGQNFANTGIKGNATSSGGNNVAGKDVAGSGTGSWAKYWMRSSWNFLADHGIADGQDNQPTIIHNAAFQTDDLDAYDSDCDDISSIKEVLMANLSSYGSDVLFE